jgi:hypothetical protein
MDRTDLKVLGFAIIAILVVGTIMYAGGFLIV